MHTDTRYPRPVSTLTKSINSSHVQTCVPVARPRTPKPTAICPSILLFSGGSAVSAFVPMLQGLTEDICYVMPVSDDGGSTSEIVKVVGGPGIGDIRSRLLGLADTSTPEGKAVHKFLAHRLPSYSSPNVYSTCPAKAEWLSILEGNHVLWNDIPVSHQYSMRAFLFQFNDKVLKQTCGTHIFSMSESNPGFDFRGASIGNIFLTGCRLFFHSLEAAIFQFAKTVGCPVPTHVLPIISTNDATVAIGVTLRNGQSIFGQCEISHPGVTASATPAVHAAVSSIPSTSRRAVFEISQSPGGPIESVASSTSISATPASHRLKTPSTSSFKKFNLSNSLDFKPLAWTKSSQSLRSTSSSSSNLFFSKSHTEVPPLASPIRRVFYITRRDHLETFPKINPLIPRQLETKGCIVYGMGSLYTSLLPCLIVPGVGGLISRDYDAALAANTSFGRMDSGYSTSGLNANGTNRVKMLILNGTWDRETEGYTAMDFILSITDTLNYSVIAERGGGDVVKKVMTKRDAQTDMDGADQVWRWRGALVGVGVNGPSAAPRRGSDASTLTDELAALEMETQTLDSLDGTEEDDENFDEEEEDISEMKSPGGRGYMVKPYPPAAFITHLLYAEDSQVPVEVDLISALGIVCVKVPKHGSVSSGGGVVDDLSRSVERGSSASVTVLNNRPAGYYGISELRDAMSSVLQ
ncbi:hypothetical protein CcCBS67573_g04433 [Chytriomyces confervae]|uniref:Uncharacterized protein n=1 Tax=Chytriomyces confervae TaxID=246404 RepID=A0A507FD71_9FUNG|nr:hypothetical protein CcCBS67573_g04433 [Chytriomyces confervae]